MRNEKALRCDRYRRWPGGVDGGAVPARAGCRTLVLEKRGYGGQIAITNEVVNYPGVPKTSGMELTDTMRRQAENFGAEFLIAEARAVPFRCRENRENLCGRVSLLRRTSGHRGAAENGGFPGRGGIQGTRRFLLRHLRRRVFFRNKDVFVIGGGFTAAEESVFLTKFARHVTMLIRKNDFACPASVADKARNHEKITVLFQHRRAGGFRR